MKNHPYSMGRLATRFLPFLRRSKALLAASLLALAFSSSARAADSPLSLQFENLSGNSSSQVWIQFLGGQQITGTYTDAILGAGQQLQANTAYSLDQLSDVSISSFSGRVYVSYGAYGLQDMGAPGGPYTPAAANTLDPNYNTRYQYMEPTIAQQADGSVTVYADLSYIDFTAISLSMQAISSTTGKVNPSVSNAQQISANTQQLVNATVGTATSAAQAVLPSGASSTLPNSEFTRVISPQFSADGTYHDFTGYLGALNGKSVNLNGTFVGTGSQPSGSENTQAQTYHFTGAFGPDGSITLSAQGDSGNSSVSWLTDGGAAHPGIGNDVTIVITGANLNSQEGIYGNNVAYSVQVGTGPVVNYTAISNDVYGRIVGDLLAGLSFGYVGSEVMFDYNGTPTALGDLPSSVWWAAGEAQGTAPVYLADGTAVTWSETPASQGIYFEKAQPGNPDYYNGYAASLVGLYNSSVGNVLTTGYGFPLQDRLGNNLLSYNTGVTPDTFILLSVNADGTSALPTSIWNAASGSWNTASNWAGNTLPAADASVQFVGASHGGTYAVDTGSDQSVSGIYFNYAAGSFTINNNTITLSGNVINSSGAGNTQTINSDIAMATDGAVVAAFGDLVFGGDIALSSSTTNTANTLTFGGNETTTVNGVISDGVTAGGSVVIAGPGTVALNGDNTFTGGLTHQQGTLVLGSDTAAGTGDFTLGSPGATLPAILQASAARTVANDLFLAGDATISGSNAVTFTGDVTISAIPADPSATPATTPQPGSPTITNTVAVEFTGAIAGATPGSAFTKAGSADMTFSGTTANTFDGLLSVNEGKLILNKSANVAAYGGDLTIGTGSTTTTATVQLNADGQTNATGTITIDTDGELDLQSFDATTNGLTMSGGSVAGSGVLTIASGGSGYQFTGTDSAAATIATGLTLDGTQTLQIANTAAAVEVTVSGPFTAGSFTKTGSGAIAFLGTNDVTGSVTITSGILATTSMSGATIALNGGALASSLSGGLAAAPLAVTDLSSSDTGAILLALGTSSASDSIAASGNVSLNAATTFLFRSGEMGAGTGAFTLITGAGLNGFDTSSLQFASIDIGGLTGTFSINGSNDLVFTAQAGVTNTWDGSAGDGQWTTAGNWVGGSAPLTGADIVFTGSTGTSVNVTTPQTTGAITFDASASAFNISGANTITLGGNLTNDSSVVQTIESAIGLNASRTVSAASGDIVLGTIALSTNGAIANTLTFTGANDITVSNLITDGPAAGGSIVMAGTGILSLTYVNSSATANFSGTFTIASGTVSISDPTSLGNQNALGTNTLIFSGGTLQLAETVTFNQFRGVNMLSTGIIDTNGNGLTIEGSIYGAGGLTKNGEGDLSLNQVDTEITNTYSGLTTINDGTLTVGFAEALGATTSGTVVNSGGSLIVNSAGNFDVTGEALTISGAGAGGDGALQLSVGQSTWDGSITLAAAASIQADASTTLTLGDQVALGAFDLTLNAEGTGIINLDGSLTGSGGLTISGGGTVNILGSNALFTGDTTVSDGILTIAAGNSLGNALTAGSLTVGPAGMLELVGTSDSTVTFSSITIAGTGSNSSTNTGAIYNASATSTTLAGDITLTAASTIASILGQLTVSGAIDNGGFDITLTNVASQMLVTGDISGSGGLATFGTSSALLSGDNTYGGATSIVSGTYITIASATALGSTTGGTTVATGGALMFDGGLSGIAVGAESLTVGGSGIGTGALNNLSGINTFAGAVTFTTATTIQATAGKLTLSGSITGTNTPLTIQGDGVVYFSGDASGLTAAGTPVIAINSGTFASGDLAGIQVSLGTGAQGDFSMPTYSPGDIGNPDQVTIGALVFATAPGPVGIIMDLGADALSSDKISVSTPSALNTAIQFYFNDNGFTTGGAYTLIETSAGAFSIPDFSVLTFKSNIAGLSGTFSGDNTNSLVFNASTTAAVYNASGSGQWTTSANWNIGTPAGGSAVSFSVTSAATVDTVGDQYAGGIEFASGSAAVEIANNAVTTYGDIVNNSSVTQTISSDLVIDGDLSINAASADLALSGDLSLSGNKNEHVLTFTGSNDTTVSGVISNGASASGGILKEGSGTVTFTGVNTYTGTTNISAGTLILDGSTATGNTIVIDPAGTLAGSGTALGKVIIAGGTISPGNSPGTFTSGDQQWLEGGNYIWQIYDATGVAGTGFDTIAITGTLDLASLTAGDFTIDIQSLSAINPDAAGNATNFNAASTYAWTLVSTTGGVTGFNASSFVLNDTAFTNATTGGEFTISTSGNNLVLNYAPVPEPSTYALLIAAAAVLLLAHRRRQSRAA